MYILIFSLAWLVTLGTAAALAWLEYGLTDNESPPYPWPESADQRVLDRSVYGCISPILHEELRTGMPSGAACV
jgi:hypothetical protein